MDHMVEVSESDIRRMQLLGLQPSSLMKDIFAESVIGSPAYESVFGLEYLHRMLPLKKYVDAGMQPTLEADTGEDQKGEPLWSIEKAVCRCVEGSDKVWGKDQKVSREDALRMKTVWAAAFTGDERKLGSLEPGKLADLVVLDGDYLAVPEDRIAELPVALTIVGGKIAYSAMD
jgi:predicted amidohydrolase YtcJ